MKKKKKKQYIDDGHTVYSMDGVDGPIWKRKGTNGSDLSKKERRAAIKAAFATYAPIFFGVLCCFGVAMILIFLWLK